jgi:transcriptional regulator with XRE-family HTH domain
MDIRQEESPQLTTRSSQLKIKPKHMELHEKLRFLRYANDYSMAYVAYKLKLTKEEYEQLESGEKKLTIEQAKLVGILYSMTSDELMGPHLDLDEEVSWQNLVTDDNVRQGHSPTLEELKNELINIKELLQVLVEKLTENDSSTYYKDR